ncbi:MAG: hypothetical protein AABW67_03170, partial [Nanoarchaeota archaeon]
QTFSTMTRGNYNVDLKCIDIAGNTASAKTSFKVKIDNTGPRITRVYYSGGLSVWTNEEANCRYAFNKFIWENATDMNGGGFQHSAPWELKTYIIQCEDSYQNKGSKMIVKPYSLVG